MHLTGQIVILESLSFRRLWWDKNFNSITLSTKAAPDARAGFVFSDAEREEFSLLLLVSYASLEPSNRSLWLNHPLCLFKGIRDCMVKNEPGRSTWAWSGGSQMP